MRVLHLSAGNLYGGVETMLVTLARHRDLCPAMTPAFGVCFDGRLRAELTDGGVPPHVLGDVRVSRYWTVLAARRRLEHLLESARPDVAICHEVWPYVVLAPAVRARRIPLAFWAHDLHTGHHWLERWASRSSPDLAIANSRATQETLKELFPRARSEVIHCPVVARGPEDRDTNRRVIRAELGAAPDAVIIVQTSRLEPWKGQMLLLRALGQLGDVPNWVAWIAGGAQRPGEQAYLAELKGAADQLGIASRVRFVGQRTDVPNLLAAADIHCQPNLGPEPFGIAFVEAMLAGLPLVTTAIGTASEIVDERSGVLVPPDDAKLLAKALRRLVVDPDERRRLSMGGPARGRNLCDPANQLKRLARQLEGLRA